MSKEDSSEDIQRLAGSLITRVTDTPVTSEVSEEKTGSVRFSCTSCRIMPVMVVCVVVASMGMCTLSYHARRGMQPLKKAVFTWLPCAWYLRQGV